mmetsp:Transcript_5442/g.14990  ORF Transcript_5442/g.14990 Transcript_5442/m.14990 type:complete len:228 (-) Transcript_5442:478-1161(-)
MASVDFTNNRVSSVTPFSAPLSSESFQSISDRAVSQAVTLRSSLCNIVSRTWSVLSTILAKSSVTLTIFLLNLLSNSSNSPGPAPKTAGPPLLLTTDDMDGNAAKEVPAAMLPPWTLSAAEVPPVPPSCERASWPRMELDVAVPLPMETSWVLGDTEPTVAARCLDPAGEPRTSSEPPPSSAAARCSGGELGVGAPAGKDAEPNDAVRGGSRSVPRSPPPPQPPPPK